MAKRGSNPSMKEIDELHAQLYPTTPEGEDNDSTPVKPAAAPETTAESAEVSQQTPGEVEAGNSENAAGAEENGTGEELAGAPQEQRDPDWEHRYNTLEGKYNSEMPQLRAELQNTQAMLKAMSEQKLELGNFEGGGLTEEEIDEYGEELIDIVQRAARAEMGPVLKQLQEQNNALQERLAQTAQTIGTNAREVMMQALAQAVPDWQAQNADKNFIDWLAQPDIYSGLTRHQLLSQAFEANDTNRVVAFFRGYKQEQTGQPAPPSVPSEAQPPQKGNGLETLVAPGRPAGTADTGAQNSGRIWTKAEIAEISRRKIAGKISREDADQLDAEIFKAAQEGRVR